MLIGQKLYILTVLVQIFSQSNTTVCSIRSDSHKNRTIERKVFSDWFPFQVDLENI